jgi:hypothetical protein
MLNGKKTIQVKRKHWEKQIHWRVQYKLKSNNGESITS